MKAILRKIRLTPKKANLVAGMVRGMPVKEALGLLQFMPKKAARIIYKVVQSAASNAKNSGFLPEDLFVKAIWATKGVTLKRATPASRGRSWPILEYTSHVTVELSPKASAVARKSDPRPIAAGKKGKTKKTGSPAEKKPKTVRKKEARPEKK